MTVQPCDQNFSINSKGTSYQVSRTTFFVSELKQNGLCGLCAVVISRLPFDIM